MEITVGEKYRHPRHGEVTITAVRPGYKLDVMIQDLAENEFWIPSCELPATLYQEGSEAELVHRLLLEGYTLRCRVPDDGEQLVFAQVEYQEWAGEPLGEECVYVRPRPTHVHRGQVTSFMREWRLLFRIQPGMRLPFRVSCGDNHFDHLNPSNEQGLLANGGTHVEVNWRTMVERLVRLGLRATERKR